MTVPALEALRKRDPDSMVRIRVGDLTGLIEVENALAEEVVRLAQIQKIQLAGDTPHLKAVK